MNETPEGDIPTKYISPINQGVRYALKAGIFGGYKMVDVKITLRDGSYHDTDSDEEAFKTAAFMAVKDAMRRADPSCWSPRCR